MDNNENKDMLAESTNDEEYLQSLAEEAEDIFDTDNNDNNINDYHNEDTIEPGDTYDTYNKNYESYQQNGKVRFSLNIGFLLLGMVVLILPMIAVRCKEANSDNKNRNEAVYSSVSESVAESVNATDSMIQFEQETEDYTDDGAMKEQHLTNIPVVVTEEVDAYFRDTIYYLKQAMSVDRFVASNELYGKEDLVNAYKKLVEDFDEELISWETRKVPAGCEDYDKMIDKSLKAYQYYFNEVAAACDLETKEEYRNKLQAAVAYVEASVDYSTTAEDFSPVFYYYGLYE